MGLREAIKLCDTLAVPSLLRNTDWFIISVTLHSYLRISWIKDVIQGTARRHLRRLRVHPRALVTPDVGSNAKRLKRLHTLELVSS